MQAMRYTPGLCIRKIRPPFMHDKKFSFGKFASQIFATLGVGARFLAISHLLHVHASGVRASLRTRDNVALFLFRNNHICCPRGPYDLQWLELEAEFYFPFTSSHSLVTQHQPNGGNLIFSSSCQGTDERIHHKPKPLSIPPERPGAWRRRLHPL